METRATEENIVKYFKVLKELHTILGYTDSLSMLKFSTQNNVTKSLSTVLQKGGVIKNIGNKGKGAKWTWNTIEPSRNMAIKCLQKLAELNPPRKKSMGGKREGSGRKTKIEEAATLKVKLYTISLFWGLFNLNIKPIYI